MVKLKKKKPKGFMSKEEAERITGGLDLWGQTKNFTPPKYKIGKDGKIISDDLPEIFTAQELGKFLRENNISPTEAINIIKKYKYKENKGDSRTTWKLWKFTLYLWLRHKEQYKHSSQYIQTGKRINTIRKLVRSDKYKRLYETFPNPKFNAENEVENLSKLISDKRQNKVFKEGNFKNEGKNKLIPQGHIDELR